MIVFEKLRYKNFLSSGNQFTEIELNRNKTTLIVGTNGSGKAQPLNAKVLTPTGFVSMGSLKVGDTIVSAVGKQCSVVYITPQGNKTVYKVHFKDGRVVECCEDHLWTTWGAWMGEDRKHVWNEKTKSTKQLIEYFDKFKHNNSYKLYVPLIKPFEGDDVLLPIDPYLMGVLIGDGHFTDSGLGITSADSYIFNRCEQLLPVGVQFSSNQHLYTRSIISGGSHKNVLRDHLKKLGLWNRTCEYKFIPDVYFTGSYKQRMALLNGLMDTDGTVGKLKCVSFTSCSNNLAKQIQQLVWSLGGIAKIRQYKERRFDVLIRFNQPENLFTLERKKQRCYNYQYKDSLRLQIVNIEKTELSVPMQCITIDDPSSLYVTDQYVATHNSTLLDALFFGLFGRPFRNINKPQLVNSITQRNCLVEIEFVVANKHYLVRRGIKPTVFEIIKDGQLINQDSDNRDYQQYLEQNILKINHKAASQIIVLGTANFVPFMQLPAQARRQFVEDLLDIQIFSIMNSILKDKITSNKTLLTDAEHQLKLIDSQLQLNVKHIEQMTENVANLIEAKRNKINEELQKIDQSTQLNVQHNYQIKELQGQIADQKKLNSKLAELKLLNTQLEKRKSVLSQEIEFYKQSSCCPTCKQDIDPSFKDQTIEEKNQTIATIESALGEMVSNIQSLNDTLNRYSTVVMQISSLNSQVTDNNTTITISNQIIESVQQEIDDLQHNHQQEVNQNQIQIQLQQQMVEAKGTINNLFDQREVLSIANQLLKDGGIKARIIKQYVPIINKLINKYLAQLDFFVQFEIDETFKEKIRSRFRDEFTYDSFSQGEKLRIDLALLFTWRAITKLRNVNSTNLLIMDEILDSSLDSAGTDEILRIIQTLANDTNTFIISHRVDQITDKFDTVIKFQKDRNFSRIVQ